MNGSSLAPVLLDRRLWLLLGTTLLAVVAGFFAFPDQVAIVFVSKAGFWFVLVAFALFLHALWSTQREEILALHWRSLDWTSVAVVAAGGTVLLVHETFGFKILMDEIMLLGTSMAMHLDKTVLTPVRGSDIQGAFVILDGMMDKRPLFFPFLASLLHDLTGYRPENLFVLNGILTFVFLGLVQLLGRLVAGRVAGWLGVALFAGLPLLAQNATGGGFELLNLVMILATVLLGAHFVRRRDAAACTAFCFSAVLMAQVRYESVIFLVPVAVLILWVWARAGRVVLGWPVLIAPLLMIHYPLQHRIFDLRISAWELGSRAGSEKVFSPHYLFHGVPPDDHGNLQSALNFFFARPTDQPNSLVFSILGCLAVPFFALLVLKRLRTLVNEPPVNVAVTVFAFGFAAHFALMMCYFFGQFDNVVIRRLSLPPHLGMVIAVMAVLPQITQAVVPRVLLFISVAGLFMTGVPSMAAHAYSQEYLPGKETAWRREFIAEQKRRDYVMIDNDSILWIAHRVSATPVFQARGPRRDALIFLMKNHAFSSVFVFQRYNINPDNGAMTLREGDDLGPDFVLETVKEERLQTLTLTRISRVKEIRAGGVAATAPDPATHTVPKSRAEIEKLRRAYLENFVKMLP
ncbi:MAG: glycosyltransferase family 39 protein [Verrucomicrobia bacterium]|nr:glycosyltransferase family 39 protein [Verrucomicrobiota bacterium]